VARHGGRAIEAGDEAGGTYALICRLSHQADIVVGRLGRVQFAPGWYVYVGSARGPGGLAARVARHLREEKRTHWHIDYLLPQATVIEVWARRGTERLECPWARALAQADGASIVPRGFGSTDCRCPGHLIHFVHPPEAHLFQALGTERLWSRA